MQAAHAQVLSLLHGLKFLFFFSCILLCFVDPVVLQSLLVTLNQQSFLVGGLVKKRSLQGVCSKVGKKTIAIEPDKPFVLWLGQSISLSRERLVHLKER